MQKYNFQKKSSKTQNNLIFKFKKRSSSQTNYQKSQDIITQVNPTYLNNFINPVNPHHSAFTPTNHSKFLQNKKNLLPIKSKEYIDKKTLILDLDETLAHSSFIPFKTNDAIIKVKFDSSFYNVYVLIRPGAIEFIKKVANLFEIILFTASIPQYALQVVDIIDVDKNIKYKLTREHCSFLNGIYIKELKKLNRDLNDLIILDNSPLAYSFDNDNGLPIKAWFDDKNDNELDKIYKILEFLSKVKNVRNYIKKFVKNNEIDFDIANEIIIDSKEKDKEKKNEKSKEAEKEIEKEIEKENKKITVNINKNYFSEIKIANYNNKENDNVNVKTEEKLIKNNNKVNKGIILNNKNFLSNYLKKLQDKSEKKYNNYLEKLNLTNKNIPNKKNRNKEIKINSIIHSYKKKDYFLVNSWLEKINNKNEYNTNINQIKPNNKFSSNKAKINVKEIEHLFYSTLSRMTKDFSFPKNKKITYNLMLENNQNLISNNNRNFPMKNRISSGKENSFNFNKKYISLMEKIEKKLIKKDYSSIYKKKLRSKSSKLNNKAIIKNKLLNIQSNSKRKKIHGGSYLFNQFNGFNINNPIMTDNKSNYKSSVIRSKSTENFINFYNIDKKPNSTKRSLNFENKLLISENRDINKYINKKANNLLESFPKIVINRENNINY